MQRWHVAPYLAAVPITDIFGKDSICDQAIARQLIFMQRYSGNEFRLEPIQSELLVSKLVSIIQFEWSSTHHLAILLSLFGLDDLLKSMEECKQVIATAVSRTKSYILYIPEAASFSELSSFFEAHCIHS
jgi:hypothetical protein